MSTAVADTSIITSDIALRNGLKFFEVVIAGWGLSNPQTAVLGPQGNKVTFLDDGLTFELPANVSLAGACIGPLSTVEQVIMSPDPNSYLGISGLSPQAAVRATGNNGANIGGQFTFETMVSVEHPLQQFMPGPITLKAAHNTTYRNRSTVLPGIEFVEPNNQILNFANDALTRDPVLQLFCWIKEPGPQSWPRKRTPYYDWDRVDSSLLTESAGEDTTLGMWPIGGRKRINLEAWALPAASNNTNDMQIGARVLLHRSTPPVTASNKAWDEVYALRSEQIYPRVANFPSPMTNPVHAQTMMQNEAAPNKLELLIENPMATFMELRVGATVASGDMYYSLRAED